MGERWSVTDKCLGRANNFVNDCMLFKTLIIQAFRVNILMLNNVHIRDLH